MTAGDLGSPGARARHFEEIHRASQDPWGFRTSWYERRKYAITMASLPRRHYQRVWEPGCSIGELTLLLADRADQVEACDISITAVEAARAATAHLPGVSVAQAGLPDPPAGRGFDLVMMSEVLYYLPDPERARSLALLDQVTAPDADLVVVHWRDQPQDAWASGAGVNQQIRDRSGWGQDWRPVARHDEEHFVLDVLSRQVRT
jgi:trans-aconitate methyltransferase